MGKNKSSRWPYIKYCYQWVIDYFIYRYWMIYFYINRDKVETWVSKNVYIKGKWLFIVHSEDVVKEGDRTFKSGNDCKIEIESRKVEHLYYSVVSFWVHKRQEYFFHGNELKTYLDKVNFSVHVWCGNTELSWGINRVLVNYFHSLHCPVDTDWESFCLNYRRSRNLRSLL